MATFRLRNKAKEWFKKLSLSKSPDFDAYYFCLMAGLTAGTTDPNVSTSTTSELVEYFPDRYGKDRELIIAYFLSRELRKLRVELSEREALNRTVSSLVDPQSNSRLSEEGVKRMNEYAAGGYDVLLQHFDSPPQHLETFLIQFITTLRTLDTEP